MAPTNTMANFLAPSTRSKRKQETIVDTEVEVPEKEHQELVQSRKKPRTAKMATKPIIESEDEFEGESAGDEKQKTKAPKENQSVKRKAINGKATPKVNTNKDAKATRKQFDATIDATEKGIAALDKKVKTLTNAWALTNQTYARNAAKHISMAQKLAETDPNLAFNLISYLADAAHTDLDATPKMCGEPEDYTSKAFAMLDKALLPLIERREKPATKAATLPKVPYRWTGDDARVGVFKTGRPNKQQRNQMYAQKIEWEKNRREERRMRREETGDWISVALADLIESRDYLKRYGVEGFLPLSIATLTDMDTARV
jgi:hypothetical protein